MREKEAPVPRPRRVERAQRRECMAQMQRPVGEGAKRVMKLMRSP